MTSHSLLGFLLATFASLALSPILASFRTSARPDVHAAKPSILIPTPPPTLEGCTCNREGLNGGQATIPINCDANTNISIELDYVDDGGEAGRCNTPDCEARLCHFKGTIKIKNTSTSTGGGEAPPTVRVSVDGEEKNIEPGVTANYPIDEKLACGEPTTLEVRILAPCGDENEQAVLNLNCKMCNDGQGS